MASYRSREGDITAVDTKTELTTLGSQTAPGALLVPGAATRIVQIIVAIGIAPVATAKQAAIFIRLEGDGLDQESPSIMVQGAGGLVTTSGGEFYGNLAIIPVEIRAKAGAIAIFAEMAGVDLGTVTIGVTLVFQ